MEIEGDSFREKLEYTTSQVEKEEYKEAIREMISQGISFKVALACIEYADTNDTMLSVARRYNVTDVSMRNHMDKIPELLDDVEPEDLKGRSKVDKEDVIEDVKKVAENNDILTLAKYSEEGKYSTGVIQNRFNGWTELIRDHVPDTETGKNSRTTRLTKEDILEDITKVHQKLDYFPTTYEYETHGKYSTGVIYERFDCGWAEIEEKVNERVQQT